MNLEALVIIRKETKRPDGLYVPGSVQNYQMRNSQVSPGRQSPAFKEAENLGLRNLSKVTHLVL